MFVPLFLITLLSGGCTSEQKSMVCEGKIQTLSGQSQGNIRGKIVDLFRSFSVETDDLQLESGPLQSSDQQKYIPSAVTREGWLLQRISDTQFSAINAPQDKMITFSCPSRAL
ncbi:hypothetical protein EHW66_09995 [Erwinia psidii]|uniref:Uncharacterized protein n=1 Tax=Erwinia psidii TaxID=69224 RepID=A0A3N6SC88_9GAMM|nr:hypothetical protein [Erwinia psidii]MCX8961740.1 hypothetical protein [Erwinia psidii]MCX8965334.1 hypothetical protein [Erwinia psidii]RQM37573.1 hypothetical protein EB241_14945 [Erwinia psidii]